MQIPPYICSIVNKQGFEPCIKSKTMENKTYQLLREWATDHKRDAFTLNVLYNLLCSELKKRFGSVDPTQEQINEVFNRVIIEGGM